jgi:hypothetical protein
MYKIAIILFTVSLNLGLFSCTPQAITGESQTYQDCCGEGGHIPPPPPPPPGGGN